MPRARTARFPSSGPRCTRHTPRSWSASKAWPASRRRASTRTSASIRTSITWTTSRTSEPGFIEPGDGRAPLLDEIRAARRSIDLEVYIITDDVILQALEEAQRRGVDVRVILEEHPFGG